MEADRVQAPVHGLATDPQLQTALPRILRVLVLAVIERQGLTAGYHGRTSDQPLVAIAKIIIRREIAAGSWKTVGLPLELIVGRYRHLRCQLELARHLDRKSVV